MPHFLLICIPVYFSSVQGERNSIHKNLVFCLFVAEVLFLAGVERTDDKVDIMQHRVKSGTFGHQVNWDSDLIWFHILIIGIEN